MNKLPLHEIIKLRDAGEFSSSELIDACIARIENRENDVLAFEHLDLDKARENARIADRNRNSTQALRGIPVGVKDVIDTHDMPTCWGSPIYKKVLPARDAACVAILNQAGGVIPGKTVTTEFACFYPGKTRNPHNIEHTPGGSSMGSAAAVADYMLPMALGTQTAASVIRPAAYCGVVGYKATQGAFSLAGICELSQTMDSMGFFVRAVDDLQVVREVFLGIPRAENQFGTSPRRIGFVRTQHWLEADKASRDMITRSIDQLSNAGAQITETIVGDDDGSLTEAQKTVMAFEVARNRFCEYKNHRQLLSEPMRTLIESGLETPFEDYQQALHIARKWRRNLEEKFNSLDCLIAPSAMGEAPYGLESTGDPLFSRMWNVLGVPCIHLPVSTGSFGLPLGFQIIGQLFKDDDLIHCAKWIEAIVSDSSCK